MRVAINTSFKKNNRDIQLRATREAGSNHIPRLLFSVRLYSAVKAMTKISPNIYCLFITFSYLAFTIGNHKGAKLMRSRGRHVHLRGRHRAAFLPSGEEYLFATLMTVTAAPYIINTDESVLALGGFNGTDPILTVSELKKFIKEGKVKYFLLSSDNSGNSELGSWIKKNGTVISSDDYSSSSSSTSSSIQQGMIGGPGGSQNQQTLYEVS